MLIDLNWISFFFPVPIIFRSVAHFHVIAIAIAIRIEHCTVNKQSTISLLIHSDRHSIVCSARVCVCDILLFWRYNKFAYLIYLPFNQFIYLFGICRCVPVCLYVCLMLFMAQTNSTIKKNSPNAMDYSFRTNFVHSIHSIENLFTFILLFIHFFLFHFISLQFDAVFSICAVAIFSFQPSILRVGCDLFFFFFFFFYIYAIHTFSQFDEFKILMAMHIIFTFGFTIRAHTPIKYTHRKIYCLLWKKERKKHTHTQTRVIESLFFLFRKPFFMHQRSEEKNKTSAE